MIEMQFKSKTSFENISQVWFLKGDVNNAIGNVDAENEAYDIANQARKDLLKGMQVNFSNGVTSKSYRCQ